MILCTDLSQEPRETGDCSQLTFCALILPMLVSLLSLARGEVVALTRPLPGPEGDLGLGWLAWVSPARLPRGLWSHCLAYPDTTDPARLPSPDDLRLVVAGDSALEIFHVRTMKIFQ